MRPYRPLLSAAALLVLFTGTLLAIVAFFWKQYDAEVDLLAQQHLTVLDVAYRSSIGMHRLDTETRCRHLLQNTALLEILTAAASAAPEDLPLLRGRLYRLLRADYLAMAGTGLTLLQFHLPDGRSLLRFYNLEHTGEETLFEVRPTVRIANRERRPVSGFESGRVTAGFRNVFPIVVAGRHLGSVELSLRFDRIHQDIMDLLTMGEYALILERHASVDRILPDLRDHFTPSGIHPDYVQENPLISRVSRDFHQSDRVRRLVAQLGTRADVQARIDAGEDFALPLHDATQSYIVSFHGIRDIEGRQVAYVVGYALTPILRQIAQTKLRQAVAAVLMLFLLGATGVFLLREIARRRRNEQELRKLTLAVEQSPESIVITDPAGTIEYVNAAFVHTTGYAPAEAVGRNPRILKSGRTPAATHAAMWATLTAGQVWRGELVNRRKDGREFIESAIIAPVREQDGSIGHYLAIKQDITEQRAAAAEINRLAHYDELTGLPNRTLLLDRLGLLLAMARREIRQDALILFNIDRFKNLNDARGHELGDRLLRAIGERLTGRLREGDTLARLAAGDFAILLQTLDPDRDSASRHALAVADAIHAALREPFPLDADDFITVTVSLGIALFPDGPDDSAREALRRADTALHRAKEAGGNQTAFFEAGMGESVRQRFRVERELRQGIAAGELRLFLQSQVDAGGTTVGAEALVRWQHPERGLLTPGSFIPVAEESDLIVAVDAWVLERVCSLMAVQDAVGRPVRLAVNVSPRHFAQPDFVNWLRDLLLATGADPGHLTLEITEGMMIDNLESMIAKMTALTMLGVHFSVDDFGTGYSSLAYLKRLPIHELKIDKTFIQDAPTDPNDAALVDTILAVARNLNLQVVAEGVETAEQAAFLHARGSLIHQGYLYSRPEPAERWLQRHWPPV